MECTGNQMASLKRGRIGVHRRRSVSGTGSVVSTSNTGVVLATLPNSLVSPRMRFIFGCTNTTSVDEARRNHARSSIGAQAARTIRCGTSEANSTRDGLAVLPQRGKRSIRVTNGNGRVRSCGNETARVAAGAGFAATNSQTCRFTSTTLCHLPFVGFVLTRPISFCFARCATTSSIHGGM